MSDWKQALKSAKVIAIDIETAPWQCIGFAASPGQAYVIPVHNTEAISHLCESPAAKVWANGIYDLYVLKYLWGYDVRGEQHDVQILWHAAYAELAGAKDGGKKKGHRFTRKSLAFLASLFTYDDWWKGEYTTIDEFFEYNGKDCCITLDVWNTLKPVVDSLNAWPTYEHERTLMWPCVDMLARGLRVDEALRTTRIVELEARIAEVTSTANATVLPLLEREWATVEALGVAHLFTEIDGVCPCCRHAKKKQQACWTCAGFDEAPSKGALVTHWFDLHMSRYEPDVDPKKLKKEVLEEKLLGVCAVCKGAPRETRRVVNLNSDTQQKIVLYEILKLPKRYAKNAKGESVLVSDEATMKSLLGGIG